MSGFLSAIWNWVPMPVSRPATIFPRGRPRLTEFRTDFSSELERLASAHLTINQGPQNQMEHQHAVLVHMQFAILSLIPIATNSVELFEQSPELSKVLQPSDIGIANLFAFRPRHPSLSSVTAHHACKLTNLHCNCLLYTSPSPRD